MPPLERVVEADKLALEPVVALVGETVDDHVLIGGQGGRLTRLTRLTLTPAPAGSAGSGWGRRQGRRGRGLGLGHTAHTLTLLAPDEIVDLRRIFDGGGEAGGGGEAFQVAHAYANACTAFLRAKVEHAAMAHAAKERFVRRGYVEVSACPPLQVVLHLRLLCAAVQGGVDRAGRIVRSGSFAARLP
mmetsp:Transcript_28626/g.93270  ORF Transcript_28626/g.93270 Transcript_28626/m.93270 type:complete len:187 (-) Transcript_28626:233-793(-)